MILFFQNVVSISKNNPPGNFNFENIHFTNFIFVSNYAVNEGINPPHSLDL